MTGGTGPWAGWSLVVVLEDPALPASRVAVFDGLRVIGVGESTEVELPAVAGGTGIVGSVVWDGDAGSTGDRVLVDGVPLVRAVSGADDDVFASWADGAVPFCAPVDAVECAAEANQLGFDTGVFEPTPIAGDRIRVEVTGGTEAVVLGVLSLVMRGT